MRIGDQTMITYIISLCQIYQLEMNEVTMVGTNISVKNIGHHENQNFNRNRHYKHRNHNAMETYC